MLIFFRIPLFPFSDSLLVKNPSAKQNIIPKSILVPLSVGVLAAITGMDGSIKSYTQNHSPLFGNKSTAGQKSDQFRNLLKWQAMMAVCLLPDSGGHYTFRHFITKAFQFSIGYSFALNATYLLKHTTHRLRPDSSDYLSFPSGHTSSAVFYAFFMIEQLRGSSIPTSLKAIIITESVILAAGCGWARIEANKHYLTDVIGGIVIARSMQLFSRWLTKRINSKINLSINFNNQPDSPVVGVYFHF